MSVVHVCLASDWGGFQVILQPPDLCSLHPCSPEAQPPQGIIPESLLLPPSHLFTENQALFRLCKDSDHRSENIPCVLRWLHSVIKSKPPLMQPEAVPSRPIDSYLGEETTPRLAAPSAGVGMGCSDPGPPVLHPVCLGSRFR